MDNKRTVPPEPTSAPQRGSFGTRDSANKPFTYSKAPARSFASGRSVKPNMLAMRKLPIGNVAVAVSARLENSTISVLPPPTSASNPSDTCRPCIAPMKQYAASSSPAIILNGTPNRFIAVSVMVEEFTDSRIAAVAMAWIAFAP